MRTNNAPRSSCGRVLHLGRVTDYESTGGRENLTVRRLPSLVPEPLKTEMKRLVDTATKGCEPMRLWRNRRLAHNDLRVAISDTPIPGISRAQIETVIESLSAVLDRIELYCWQSETQYEGVIAPAGDADSLVYYLLKGIRSEEGQRQRLRDGKPLREDFKDEELP